MPQDLTDDKSTLVQVMAWCRMQQAITWTSVDQDLQRHMASLCPNELTVQELQYSSMKTKHNQNLHTFYGICYSHSRSRRPALESHIIAHFRTLWKHRRELIRDRRLIYTGTCGRSETEITACTGSCHFDNFLRSQRRKFHKIGRVSTGRHQEIYFLILEYHQEDIWL